jgi:hypothetical protein
MEQHHEPAIIPSDTERSNSWPGQSCPECEERSYLRTLVAELLYRNQVLRFDLMQAQDRVEQIEPGRSERGFPYSATKVSDNTLV